MPIRKIEQNRNCILEDTDLMTNVRLTHMLDESRYGYFIEIRILKSDVVKFLEHGIFATFNKDGYFTLKIRITNSTRIFFNRAQIFEPLKIKECNIPVSDIKIRKLIIKKYSSKSQQHYQCYATRILFVRAR